MKSPFFNLNALEKSCVILGTVVLLIVIHASVQEAENMVEQVKMIMSVI